MFAKLAIPALIAGSTITDSPPDKTNALSNPEIAINLTLTQQPDFFWDPICLSELFAEAANKTCRYNDSSGRWLVYNGRSWCDDKNKIRVEGYVKMMSTQLKYFYPQMVSGLDQDQEKKIRNIIFRKMTERKFRTDLIADSRDILRITSPELNRGKHLFNVRNGTLNLDTFELQDHNPGDFITRYSNVFYAPDAHSQIFNNFLKEITCGDKELEEYIQMVLGYCLTGYTPLECMWLFWGVTTRNGKSTLLEAIRLVFGGTAGYAMTTNPATFTERRNEDATKPSGDIARIEGYRLMIVEEPKLKMILDSSKLKTLTGRDMIVARPLFEGEREFLPEVKIIMNSNHLPLVNDVSIFESYRMIVIPFPRHFEENEIDPTVKTKLQSPEVLSAILNWLLEGLRKYRERGLLHRPGCVERATQLYRETSDYILQFFTGCMKKAPGKNTQGLEVYERYKEWAVDNEVQILGKKEFFEDLRSRGFLANTATIRGKTVKNVVIGYRISKSRKSTCK